MPKSLEILLAEAEIRDLHVRTCRANDRRDEALMRSCFHPDAVIELHEDLDIDAFIELGRVMLSRYVLTWHNTGNQLVEVSGDVAWGEHYTISSHRIAASEEGPERDFIAYGRYIDRAEKRDGEWKFARRRMVLDYTRMDPVPPGPEMMGNVPGARDRSDPSYAWRLYE